MKKTFEQLSIIDTIYLVASESTKIKEIKAVSINSNQISTDVSNGGSSCFVIDKSDFDKTWLLKYGYHHICYYFFMNKSDALRYAKSQAFRELRNLKDEALKAIKKLKDFRDANFQQLNCDWMESEITKIERFENQI